MNPRVVNLHKNQPFDIYIGRSKNSQFHWGNPWTHLPNVANTTKVDSRELALECFRKWICGEAFFDVEPQRRDWMLRNLHLLKGKTLGCFCAPLGCHGEILLELAERAITPENVDIDLYAMSRTQLISAVMSLRTGTRDHRDQRGDDKCWMDDEKLYKLLPEGYTPPARDTAVELANCRKYICSRMNPATIYISPQRRIEELELEIARLKNESGS